MGKKLKIFFFTALGLSVVAGLPIDNPYGIFFWHEIPSIDVIFGIVFPLIIIGAKTLVATIAQRKESFYD